MRPSRPALAFLCTAALSVPGLAAADAAPLYAENFDKLEAVPDDLVCNGEYTLVAEGAGKALALNPNPVDNYNFLFGPSRKDGASVRAKIRAEKKGRQSPTFGIGVNGISGVTLQLATAKDAVELVQGDAVVATAPYAGWTTATWIRFQLTAKAGANGSVTVEGKVWADGKDEPAAATITTTLDKPLPAGRAVAWGNPIGGKPILFDELVVEAR